MGDRGYGEYTKGVKTTIGAGSEGKSMKQSSDGHFHQHLAASGAKGPLGTGHRFKALEEKLEKRGNVRDPGALAASIGRKKYGAKRFSQLSKGEK